MKLLSQQTMKATLQYPTLYMGLFYLFISVLFTCKFHWCIELPTF